MRKLARECAFKVIYKSFFINDQFSIKEILENDNISADEDVEFVNSIVDLYKQNECEINKKINLKLKDYTPERVYRIDRAILCVALTEILFYKSTPVKVVINEAIEMAKKYSTEKSFSFVNGMLKSLTEGTDGV